MRGEFVVFQSFPLLFRFGPCEKRRGAKNDRIAKRKATEGERTEETKLIPEEAKTNLVSNIFRSPRRASKHGWPKIVHGPDRIGCVSILGRVPYLRSLKSGLKDRRSLDTVFFLGMSRDSRNAGECVSNRDLSTSDKTVTNGKRERERERVE